jgi:hypothetical protein
LKIIHFYSEFNVFASQFAQPARPLPRRARGHIAFHSEHDFSPRERWRYARGIGFTPKDLTVQEKSAWEASRSLLQPVKFVPAESHRTLFQEIDEILQLPKQSCQTISKVLSSVLFAQKI